MQHLFSPRHGTDAMCYLWFAAMHTRVDIVLCGDMSEQAFVGLGEEIEEQIAGLERTGNCYSSDSELSVLLATRSGDISPTLHDMLMQCVDYHKRTLGYFDIAFPSDNYNVNTLGCLRLMPHTATIDGDGVRLNLSGFLKGYALDQLRPLLESHGIAHALLNMGNSTVMAMGNYPDGEGWQVAMAGSHKSLRLVNESLSISGNDTASRRHIVNPRSQRLVTGQRTVAVTSPVATDAEVLSTALFAAEEDSDKLLARFPGSRLV